MTVDSFAITGQPVDLTVNVGETAEFTVVATGSGLTYQWQYSTNGGTNWYNTGLNGATTATLSFVPTSAFNGRMFRCVVKSGSTTKISESATLTVDSFAITGQPADLTVSAGETAEFTVVATGSSLTYQWQYSTNGGTNWYNTGLNGATTATLSFVPTSAFNGRMFRCVVKSGSTTKISESATLTVDSFAITGQPADLTVSAGKTAEFTVVATGNDLTYQWQYSTNGGANWYNTGLNGATTETLSFVPTAIYNGRMFRCVVRSGSATIISESATLTVENFAITTQPADLTVSAGDTAEFTVVAVGNGLTYQWQYSADGGENWSDVELDGASTSTLSFTAADDQNGYMFQCIVGNANEQTLISESATLTVDSRIIINGVTYLPISSNTLMIVSYDGTASSLVIPENPVEGMTVTEVGESAFEGNTVLVSIDLPDTIVAIRRRAFAGCSSLSQMN